MLLPVPVSVVTELQDGAVLPAGKVYQQTLTTTGRRIFRDLLTHDLSFWITRFYTSINSRCNLNKYPLMIHRASLLQTIHFMVALCADFSDRKILVSKFSFSGRAAAQSILIVGQIADIALRLLFERAINPAAWSCCSEMIIVSSKKLLLMKNWDPRKFHSPDQVEVQALPGLPQQLLSEIYEPGKVFLSIYCNEMIIKY